MSIFQLAQKYYPRLWSRERIEALAAAGKLTQAERSAILKEGEDHE